MIRKDCFEKVGMYREQFILCQAYDMWLRISEQFQIGILDSKLYYYRVWDDAISYKGVALNNTLKEIIKKYAEQHGQEIVEAFYKKDNYRWLSEQ